MLYWRLARDPFQLVTREGLTWLESTALARFSWLVHGFSTRLVSSTGKARSDGRKRIFNLGITADSNPRYLEANRRRFCGALGGDLITASLRQIHSATVYQVVRPACRTHSMSSDGEMLEYRPAGWPLPDWAQKAAGDALTTSERGVLLTIRTADCLPVLLVDSRLRVVAAIHAGWRGALARIIEKTVGELGRLFESRPEHLEAALGPGIGPCCYEVGDEVVDAFQGRFVDSNHFFRKPAPGAEPRPSDLRYTLLFHTQASPGRARPGSKMRRLHLDLASVARAQLLTAGLDASAIHSSGHCTACRSDLFFSHRREGSRAGRMLAAIAVRP
ncbi:MAG TPA: peptidoglycan editing factor PgeF [Terriglobia bacterium]